MTKITPHQDFAMTSAKKIEADLAAGRLNAGLPPLSIEECEIAFVEAMRAMDANRTDETRKEAEICRRALCRARDEHEQATRTGRFEPYSAADWYLGER